MIKDKKINILRISRDICYKIYLNDEKLILEELISNNKNIFKLREQVLDYSVYLDGENRIHIIYINSNEEIKYITYTEYMNEVNILSIKDEPITSSLKVKIFNSNTSIRISFFDKGNISVQWSNMYYNKQKDVLCFQKDLESYIALELSRDIPVLSLVEGVNKANDKEGSLESSLNRIKERDDRITELKGEILNLEKEMYNYNEIKKEEIENIKRYYQEINKYEKKIQELKEEKNKVQLNSDMKINSLLKILEEKNNIISNLHKLLKEK